MSNRHIHEPAYYLPRFNLQLFLYKLGIQKGNILFKDLFPGVY